MATITAPTPGTSAGPTGRGAPGRRNRRRSTTLVGWSFILPNFIGFALLTLVPVIASLALSFLDWDGFNAPEFVGLANFDRMVHNDTFWTALRNTAYYAVGHVPLTIIASLGFAVLLNQKLRAVQLFRTALFFPYITSLVAVAVVWNMLLSPESGPVNQLLQAIGIANPPGWTSSSTWAMPAVIIASVWRDMGYYMVLYLAGLQTIPSELYEAAAVDGASAWQRFRHITIPSLRPTTFFVLIMVTISSFKVFDLIQVMTEGGPGRSTLVLSQVIYREGIVNSRFGYSSAVSMVLFLVVLLITVVQFRLQRKGES